MAADAVDDTLFGRQTMIAGYEILGLLGRGAMGVVFQARQRGLRRVVALKMIRAGSQSSPDELARFRSEAVAVAELQHPNIVQLYEVGEVCGQPYFSLEYINGPSLARKINGTPQPPLEAARVVRALAQGMEVAHRRGIVHRDLKPANVLLTAEGEPKISDFGLVKRLEEDAGNTQSGSILGTPSYMAPEQAEGRIKDIGPRADVYAIGAILYELLTGRPPFRAASVLDTLHQVRTQEPIPPSQFQPNVPRDLETICLKCLQKDAAKRYATAADLSEDLRRFGAREPIMARPVGRAERLWRWCRRNPKVAALSAAVGLLVLAWTVTSTFLFRLARTNERAAVANAAKAIDNEVIARNNAETASRNAEQARANAALAKRRADAATVTARDAISQMIRLGEQVLRRIQSKHDPARAEAEWLRLRDDLTGMLMKELVPMAERIENQAVTSFAVAASHQQLGDLLRKFGQGEAARRQYQHGFDSLERIVHNQPVNDQARANLGVILLRLGDTALDLDGDAEQSRKDYNRAWDIQDQIARQPRSKQFTDVDNRRILANIELKMGIAELSLGHPAQARDWFRRALANRAAWTDAEPQNVSARSFLSETELWMGIVHTHLDEWPVAQSHFERAAGICDELSHRFPRAMSFRGDVATVRGEYGDALARIGKDAEAETALRQSLEGAKAVVAHDPDDIAQRSLLAIAHERLASVARRRGKLSEMEIAYRVALEIRRELAELEPANLPRQADLALALAHCGRRDEAARQADQLLRAAADRTALALPLARCFAACAAANSDEVIRHRDGSRMLDMLGAVIRNGYRDTFVLRTDPDLDPFRSDLAFKMLTDRVKPSSK